MKKKPSLPRNILDKLGYGLRTYYDAVARLPLPAEHETLLAKLREVAG